ncbi:MAG: hypothetical protein NQ127_03040 [Candidatus Cardinium sp.]|nr:hypothetical protein [Candidatus Cardinium sp.]
MKKKAWYWFVFCLSLQGAVATPSVATTQKLVISVAQMDKASDTYQPIIEQRYFVFVLELLKKDWLHQSGNSSLSIERWSWRDFMRWPAPSLLYAVRIKKSRFAIGGGIGLSTLQYSFKSDKKENYTLRKKGKNNTGYGAIDSEDLGGDNWGLIQPSAVKYSQWNVFYMDLLLGMRFNSVLEQSREGVHVWLGGKLGVRLASATAIGYEAHDAISSLYRNNDFNLNRFAFSGQIGIGYRFVGLIGSYTFTPLFSDGVLRKRDGTTYGAIKPCSVSFYLTC